MQREAGQTQGLRLHLLILGLVLGACGECHAPAPPSEGSALPPLVGMRVAQSMRLTQGEDGWAGSLELMVDTRLTDALRDELWATGRPDDGNPDQSSADGGLSPWANPRPAVLQVRDAQGAIRDRWNLEHSLARLEPRRRLSSSRALFWLSVDYSALAGAYNGPITTPIEIEGGRLHAVEVVNEQGARTPLRLMRSLRSDWRFAPARTGTGEDILHVFTAEDPKRAGEFVVTYERLTFDGRRWARHLRQEDGVWESDEEFPSEDEFP